MAKRLTHNVITGNDPRLRICFYYSPYFDQNILRRGSSLTGERTKKDPAFKGFRQSSSRLMEASPIAASLYKMVPKQLRQYALYRTLTGDAIKMLKDGMAAAIITETLKKKYIDPLLDAPEKNSETRTVKELVSKDQVKGVSDFTSFPQIPSRARKFTRARRSYLLHKNEAGQSAMEYFSSTHSDLLLQTSRIVSESPFSEPVPPEQLKPRTKTTSGMIYLGRLPECKKLKIWVRPVDYSILGSII
jgi:hypothetical protein